MPFLDTFQQILTQTYNEFASFSPRFLAALVIFILGSAIARAGKRVITKVLGALSVSRLTKDTPVEHFLQQAELTQRIEEIVGMIVYWLIMLVVVQTSVTVLGLSSLSDILSRVLGYVPHILSAILVLVFGVLVAGLIESLIKGSLKSLDAKSARFMAKVASYLVVTVASLAAVSELGIASEFIMVLFIGLIAALSLGFGLALGLGGKDVVGRILESWYEKTSKEIGE